MTAATWMPRTVLGFAQKRKSMTPAGFEPATLRPGIESSTRLSHEATDAHVETRRQTIYHEAPETIEFEFQLCPFPHLHFHLH